MNVQTQWLDWNEPCLPAAARWLIDQCRKAPDAGRLCRLDHIVCIVQGKRGGRLLLEYLLRECESRDLHLVPPRTITPGVMREVLCEAPPEMVAASTGERTFAWAAALRQLPGESLAPLLARVPAADDVLAWHELAKTVQRLHEELAGQCLSFADAADQAERLEMFGEADRWRALQHVHQLYAAVLAQAGLTCPHADSDEPSPASSITGEHHVVLIGIVELHAQQRSALKALAGHGVPVTALVHAQPSLADRCDSLGCVVPEAWADATIDVDPERIVVADRPSDQAQEAVRFIASSDYSPQQITIGLAEAELSEPVQHAGAWADLAVHPAEGTALARSLPYRLLEAVAHWLDGNRFADFASLLRHPDIERWLEHRLAGSSDEVNAAIGDWLALLDRYFAEHLHQRLDGAWLGTVQQQRRLKAVFTQVQQLLSPLTTSRSQPLGQWSDAILTVVREVYCHRKTLPHQTREACLGLRDVLESHTLITPQLQPTTDAATALQLTLREAADTAIATPSQDDQVEMLGWLELHLDPAPALVVLGVNDGQLPSATVADAFLPDRLRTALGLLNNARRYARDAYLLQATINSRPEVLLVAGRRATDGEPLAPSRLLLAIEAEQLPQRVGQLCEEKHARRWPLPLGGPSPSELCQFIAAPPPPSKPPPLEKLAVTAFRSYLACPYRFWLGQIERLRAINDAAEEMDPLNFGSFTHQALERFGQNRELRDCTDAELIDDFLRRQVDELALATFGKRAAPAVRVQVERLKRRLEAFSRLQAQLRSEGWVIKECEFSLPEQTYLDIPGQDPLRITGKIDRIDQHESTGAYRLIDYKTSEGGTSPFEVHHGGKKFKEDYWLDLQLPLYRFLAAQHGYKGSVEVGYIVLPKQPDDVAYSAGLWSEEQFDMAIDKAREVVRDIRAGRFDPNPDFHSNFDDVATICRTNVLGGDEEPGEGSDR